MQTWKTKSIDKKRKNSHTPGKSKGENCKADWRKKYFMSHAHAYKNKEYGTWVKKAREMNGV